PDGECLPLFLLRNLKRDSCWSLNFDRVAIAKAHNELVALHLGAITHPVDFQRFGVALGDAGHHVLNQRSSKAMLTAIFAIIIWSLDAKDAIFANQVELGVDGLGEFTLWPLDRNDRVLNVDRHLIRDRNGL